MKFDLLQRRKELNLTLEEIGKHVGVSKSTVKKWETGYIENMKRDKIALLAEILQVSPLIIMGYEEKVSDSTSQIIKPILNEEHLSLIAKYDKLNKLGKSKTHDYIDDLLEHPKYIASSASMAANENPTKPVIQKNGRKS